MAQHQRVVIIVCADVPDADEAIRAVIRDRLSGGARLTRREWEVLELLNEGLGTSEIASRLYVADVTVLTLMTAIIRKLQVENRDGAAAAVAR